MPKTFVARKSAARVCSSTSTCNTSVWIHDELLSSSFSRWVRTARIFKRNGSSIPGPLEARRRLNGRKLTAAASIDNGSFTASLLPSLWGFRSSIPEISWKYEAPLPAVREHVEESITEFSPTPIGPENLDTPPEPKPKPADLVALGRFEARVRHCLSHDVAAASLQDISFDQQMGIDLRDLRWRIFRNALQLNLPISNYLPFFTDAELRIGQIDYLGSLLDHIEAQGLSVDQDTSLFTVLLNVLQSGQVRSSDISQILKLPLQIARREYPNKIVRRLTRLHHYVWDAIRTTFTSIGSQQLDSVALYQILDDLITVKNKRPWPDASHGDWHRLVLSDYSFDRSFPQAVSDMISRTSDRSLMSAYAHRVFLTLLVDAFQALEKLPASNWTADVTLDLARKCRTSNSHVSRTQHLPLKFWFKLLHLWIRKEHQLDGDSPRIGLIARRSIHPEAFQKMSEKQSCIALMHTILPFILERDVQSSNQLRKKPSNTHFGEVQDLFLASMRGSHQELGHSCIGHLLNLLEQRGFRLSAGNLTWILKFIYQAFGTRSLLLFLGSPYFRYARDTRRVIIPNFIISELAKTVPRTVLRIVKRGGRSHRTILWDTLLKLLGRGAITAGEIGNILRQFTFFTPVHRRLRLTRRNSLPTSHISFINGIATTLAHSNVASNRTAFRGVYQLYRYLRNHGAPMESKMLKSLVYSGIVRPLLEFEWPHASRITFILSVVQKHESEQTARRLDALFVQWRSHLLRLAKKRWEDNGMTGPVQVNYMKRTGLWDPAIAEKAIFGQD